MQHLVIDIQRFCMHDGPGIRSTVFLKGCPLRCFWCHNPETHKRAPELLYYPQKCIGCGACFACERGAHFFVERIHTLHRDLCLACGNCAEHCPTGALEIAGKRMESEDIIAEVLKDTAFYGKEGGLTLSGGEPMFDPEACIELLTLAKQKGLHTAVETSGYFPSKYVAPLSKVTDLLLWDIKDTDDTRHEKNTGVSNARILENLYLADTFGVPIILRCILLKGINDEEHFRAMKRLKTSLKNVVNVEFLPCHSLGNAKSAALGNSPTDLTPFLPSDEDVKRAYAIYNEK